MIIGYDTQIQQSTITNQGEIRDTEYIRTSQLSEYARLTYNSNPTVEIEFTDISNYGFIGISAEGYTQIELIKEGESAPFFTSTDANTVVYNGDLLPAGFKIRFTFDASEIVKIKNVGIGNFIDFYVDYGSMPQLQNTDLTNYSGSGQSYTRKGYIYNEQEFPSRALTPEMYDELINFFNSKYRLNPIYLLQTPDNLLLHKALYGKITLKSVGSRYFDVYRTTINFREDK